MSGPFYLGGLACQMSYSQPDYNGVSMLYTGTSIS